MSRGGYKGACNFPHEFEVCPQCGKKGFYQRVSPWRDGGMEKVCRYCHHSSIQFVDRSER